MKNLRIPLLVALGVAILGIILGSFFDLKLSESIASASNGLGLALSAIGPTIGFAGMAVIGGGFIRFAIKGDYPKPLKLVFLVIAAGCLLVAILYSYGEYFGQNGFYGKAPKWVGLFIVILPETGAMVGGYFLFRDCQNKNMWIVFMIILTVLFIAMVVAIPSLKALMHRPRYRLIVASSVEFHNWWEPCKNYKELMEITGSTSENFKSYPSGHTTEASILLASSSFLPLANNKFKKYQPLLFTISSILIVIVGFARILAAAHFLSDVSTGATIVILLTVIANEVIIRIKPLHIENQGI